MSKLLFATILRKNSEVSNCQLEYFWQQAKTANLPEKIFKKIHPFLHLFPVIQTIYRQHGMIDGLTCKQDIKDCILDLLKDDSCYTKSIIESVPANHELTLCCINELLIAERIKYQYCMMQNSRLYSMEVNYQNIQHAIIKVLKTYDVGVEKHHICNEVKGVKKKAVSQNLTDLFKSGQIKFKQGKYTC